MKCVAIPLHQQYIVHNMYYLAHMNRESTENIFGHLPKLKAVKDTVSSKF